MQEAAYWKMKKRRLEKYKKQSKNHLKKWSKIIEKMTKNEAKSIKNTCQTQQFARKFILDRFKTVK